MSLIYKVIAFYLENQANVDAMIAENTVAMSELEAKMPRTGPALEELQRRMALKAPRRGGVIADGAPLLI